MFIFICQKMNEFDFKSLILTQKEPIVIKHILKWNLLKWNLNDWESVLNNELLEFRSGVYERTDDPQWERKTSMLKGDFKFFISQSQNNKKEWLYFDYKHLKHWFRNLNAVKQEINWSAIGFPEIKPEECTIWIGSKGAHTPCHMDCYGFNLVYQIFGTKLWLLFPPEENLKATRIPYEESSIYSKLNFFSPKVNDFIGLANNCRKIVLNPGDVLFVPHKWWHYVENLETSISINVWLPMAEDNEERLKESMVQYFVKQVTEVSNSETNKTILNPNMDEVILENSIGSFVEMITKCKNICRETSKELHADNEVGKEEKQKINSFKTEDFIVDIPILSQEEFLHLLNQHCHRFDGFDASHDGINKPYDDNVELLETLTNPEIINHITKIYLKNKS